MLLHDDVIFVHISAAGPSLNGFGPLGCSNVSHFGSMPQMSGVGMMGGIGAAMRGGLHGGLHGMMSGVNMNMPHMAGLSAMRAGHAMPSNAGCVVIVSNLDEEVSVYFKLLLCQCE